MDEHVLSELKRLAQDEGRTFASVLTAAAQAYLERVGLRPAVRDAIEEVTRDHEVLLARLAK